MLDCRPNFNHKARGLVSQHHWIFDHKVCNSAMLPIVNIWSTDPNGVHLEQNICKNGRIWHRGEESGCLQSFSEMYLICALIQLWSAFYHWVLVRVWGGVPAQIKKKNNNKKCTVLAVKIQKLKKQQNKSSFCFISYQPEVSRRVQHSGKIFFCHDECVRKK